MSRVPPVRVVRAATAVRTALQSLTRRMVPPQVGVLELASGAMTTHVLYAAARLGVADALAVGPRPAEEVAAETGAAPDAMYRLLRACATYGVLTEGGDARFALTPLGEQLRSDVPGSMRPVVLMLGDADYQRPWTRLADSVTTGRTGAELALGRSMWQHVADSPGFAATFNDAMSTLAAMDWPAVAAVHDFTSYSSIVDLGGGDGRLLSLMLQAAPEAKGVLQELEQLVPTAEAHLRATGVIDRCRVEAASFFETAPTDGDLYVMRRVVHDFDDDDATAILDTVRRHMPHAATLLLMESVVPPHDVPHFVKVLDLDMMLFVGGRERTERELTSLLDRAGFSLNRIIPTVSMISLVEAVPRRGS